jgi:hypothetical protein
VRPFGRAQSAADFMFVESEEPSMLSAFAPRPKKSMDIFSPLGSAFNPQFTDEKAACMIISAETGNTRQAACGLTPS